MNEFVREIASLVITVAILFVCIVCAVITCFVCCSPKCCKMCPTRHQQRDNESEEDDDETIQPRVRDLSEAPPPAYRHVEEYKNVDLEHVEVVRLKQTMYRLSSHPEPESESLPPDYVSNRGEDEMSERVSISVAPQQTPEGELPPTYSTAQLELMARRTATEQIVPSSSDR